jgi:hypothetical protein
MMLWSTVKVSLPSFTATLSLRNPYSRRHAFSALSRYNPRGRDLMLLPGL